MRNTYTVVTLEINAAAYDEIAQKLRAADYGHCFNSEGEIDMTGIAVVRGPEPTPFVSTKVHICDKCDSCADHCICRRAGSFNGFMGTCCVAHVDKSQSKVPQNSTEAKT